MPQAPKPQDPKPQTARKALENAPKDAGPSPSQKQAGQSLRNPQDGIDHAE